MSVTLVLILALAVALLVIILVAKMCRNLQEEKTRLEVELSKQKNTAQQLRLYAEELVKITDDKEKVADQIKEAKSDEEILAIIAGLVHANNDRVRDKAKG
jgi:flagellar biosynthesis/type III secretory pathway M-ring protein FliF/YscJ